MAQEWIKDSVSSLLPEKERGTSIFGSLNLSRGGGGEPGEVVAEGCWGGVDSCCVEGSGGVNKCEVVGADAWGSWRILSWLLRFPIVRHRLWFSPFMCWIWSIASWNLCSRVAGGWGAFSDVNMVEDGDEGMEKVGEVDRMV